MSPKARVLGIFFTTDGSLLLRTESTVTARCLSSGSTLDAGLVKGSLIRHLQFIEGGLVTNNQLVFQAWKPV